MKTKEEIKQLAEHYLWGKIFLTKKDKYQTEIAYMSGYTQCQKDMIIELKSKESFIAGAKWQQERMFELVEEYNQMLLDTNVHEDHKEKSFKEWFEQFKKK